MPTYAYLPMLSLLATLNTMHKKRRFYLISETLLLILFIVRESRSSFHLCKLSYAGSEYVGKFSQTSSNEPCQSWTDSEPHCAASTFADHTFPDGSKKLANNYCRNPDKNKDGPWCYPLNPMKDREPCKVPTCSNDKCRWTGPGMEYTGPSRESLKNRECSPWSTDSEKFRHLDEFKQSFPEGNRMLASRGCRNPTEDLGGPWCFVVTEEEITNNVQYLKEYCDIPFCFPMDGIAVVDDHPSIHYTHYWDIFHPLDKSVDIAFKLWAPGDWDGAEIRIGLSSLPLPVTGKEMRDLVFGYEIILRNNNATITRIGDEQEISVNEPGLINGLTWTNLTISWAHGKLCVKLSDRNTPLMLLELMNPSETILDRENIKYISHQSNVLMFLLVNNFAKSTMEKVDVEERLIELEDFCAKHTTNSARFRSYFLLRKARIGRFRDLNLYVRGFNVNIKLTPTPSPHLPYVLLQISSCSCTVSIVHAHAQIVIAREEIQGLLSYWSWSHFEFILSESRLQLFLHFDKRIRIMVDITDRHITPVRWFAVSSNGEAHWTFFCSPDKIKLFEPYPPECISSSLGFEYTGHQSVTQEGNPCFPWIIPHTLDLVDAHFRVDGTILRAVNYCRNPTNDPAGPFCLTRNRNGLLEKSACNVQHCKFMGCRFAGTGDDYFGISTVTRFNKTCQFWTNDKPHLVDHELLKDELFPERCPKNSHNYCRNPSRDVGGPWCYTTDPNVKKDLCNVPDCFEPEACTLIVRGQPSNKIFIDPRKRTYGIKFKAKIWNPLSPTVLTFTFYPKFGKEKMTFEIGAENNQLLRLYFHNKHGRRALLKQFTFPHILFIGKWAGLTLIARQYRFDAKFTESSETFFSWRYSSSLIYYENICRKGRSVSVRPFDPVYFSYGGGSGKTDFIGLSFPCDDCHSEVAERPNTDGVVYYPVNLWSEKACGDSFQDMNLKIHLKGRGNAKITFFNLPSSGHPIIQIILKAVGNHTVIVRNEKIENICDVSNKPELYSETKWTDFQIGARVSKAEGEIRRKGEVISYWKHFYTPVYFFTVEALDDELLWTTTCTPPDTETGALDAGWSEWSDWTCSAKCGGGRGFRFSQQLTRTCTNPRPSLYGNSCEGKSYMFGLCNTFKCGKISPFTLAELNEELRTVSSIQLKVDQGQTVKIPCSPRRLKMVKNEEPTAMIQWMKNSRPVAPEVQLNGVDENDYSLTVSNVTQQSTGVYACMVHTSDGITTAIEITTVLVLTARPLSMRTGDTLVLPTNALILGKVFNRLTMVWSINSVLYKSSDYYYDIDGNETISPLFEEHEGMWECSIHQNALNLTWTTYLIKVEVVPKPCFSDYLEGSIIQKTLSGNLQNESEFWPLTVSVYVLILGFVYVIVHAMVKKMASHGRTEPSNEDAAVPLMMEERLLSSQTSLGSRKICSQVNPSYQSTPPISPVLDSCDVTTTDQYGNTTTDLFGNTTERYSSA